MTSLEVPHDNMRMQGSSGDHALNKNFRDVRALFIQETNSKYIPADLRCMFNLSVFRMVNTQLIEITTSSFYGMQNLISVDLWYNKITYLPNDAFTTLSKLKFLDLGSNKIEILPAGLFDKNLHLEKIYLGKNRISIIAMRIFHSLSYLNYVDLLQNVCIDKHYKTSTEITQLRDYLKTKCHKTTIITTSPTTCPYACPDQNTCPFACNNELY